MKSYFSFSLLCVVSSFLYAAEDNGDSLLGASLSQSVVHDEQLPEFIHRSDSRSDSPSAHSICSDISNSDLVTTYAGTSPEAFLNKAYRENEYICTKFSSEGGLSVSQLAKYISDEKDKQQQIFIKRFNNVAQFLGAQGPIESIDQCFTFFSNNVLLKTVALQKEKEAFAQGEKAGKSFVVNGEKAKLLEQIAQEPLVSELRVLESINRKAGSGASEKQEVLREQVSQVQGPVVPELYGLSNEDHLQMNRDFEASFKASVEDFFAQGLENVSEEEEEL